MDPPTRQARWKTLLRGILVLPSGLILYALGTAFEVVTVLMWFAALFTARVPAGMWRFNLGVLRFHARLSAFVFLLTDVYPPFSLDDVPYPVRVELGGPPARFNRLAVLFRCVLAIPAAVVSSLFVAGLLPFLIASWLVTVVIGRNPRPFHDVFSAGLRYLLRYYAYFCLLTTEYPKDPLGRSAASSGGFGSGALALTSSERKLAGVAIALGVVVSAGYVMALPVLVTIPRTARLMRFNLAYAVGVAVNAELQYENSLNACNNSVACAQRASSNLLDTVATEDSLLHDVDFLTAPAHGAGATLASQMEDERTALEEAVDASTPAAFDSDQIRAQALEIAVVSGLRQLGGKLGAVSTGSGTTSYAVTATTVGPSAMTATAVGIQPQDVGTGFTATVPGDVLERRSSPGPCTPLTSAPWRSLVGSPQYSANGTSVIVSSTVAVLADAGAARRAFNAVSTPTYGPGCYQPGFDADYRQSTSTTDQSTPCKLSVGTSSITPIAPGSAGPGVTGWDYQTSFHCRATGSTTAVYQQVLNEVVGKVFIQENVRSVGSPSPVSWEAQLMDDMAARAEVPVGATSPTTVPPVQGPTSVASAVLPAAGPSAGIQPGSA